MWFTEKGKKAGASKPKGRKREFPIRAADYELLEPIGDGATAVVRRARCLPHDGEIVAIKIMNIHRDVKAGNILLDQEKGVKLSDFGVTARWRLKLWSKRITILSTFLFFSWCFQHISGEYVCPYSKSENNYRADIWSFGITAVELAIGHAPFSSQPPAKVFLMTLTHAPPSLNNTKEKKFTEEQETKLQAERKPHDKLKEKASQEEYIRGVSEWNFDIEDLRAQAARYPDEDEAEAVLRFVFEIDTVDESSSSQELQEQCCTKSDEKMVNLNF
ncbi:hypothetical protein PR202_ga06648 [Eleusine coracana subsp. coracana]|uniref:Protein kinase domain-containing protein n=1 Tax=Eleusine coracana subsp. coracana TaxID=191504 RepID=A0AAV5BVM4_ELECO|nr:hypothetical protein PR202_ga06648 [Eleusine coracana subsp. coracana]